jgi:ABC-type nitrate/sulfonate/bicarbonate transport system substrate-binding protein
VRRERLTRRQFLIKTGVGGTAFVLAPSLLAACGDDGEPASPTTAATATGTATATTEAPVTPTAVRFRTNWIPSVDFFGWYVGADQGYFEEEAIDIEVLGAGFNSPETVQVLAGGGAEVGLVTDVLTLVDSNAQGTDFVIWGARLQKSPFGLLSLADNPINTPQDMVGRTLGGPEGDQAFLDAVLEINGLEAGSYDFVPIGFDATPLVNGRVEGMTAYATNQPLYLDIDGIDNVMVLFADMGMPSYADMLFADRAYLNENHDLMVGFLRATIRGWEYANASPENTEYAINLMLEEYGGADAGQVFDQSLLNAEANIPLMESPNGMFSMDPEELAGPMYDALRATGRENLPDPATILDLTILEEVHGA